MIYKSLFFLVFANMFNQAYQMTNIECPRWVPGTNEILPRGVTLSPELELQNRVRCYCEVVLPQERGCLSNNVPRNLCKARTAAWVEDNLMLRENFRRTNQVQPLPQRDRMINVQP
jgi:hypothetical protein